MRDSDVIDHYTDNAGEWCGGNIDKLDDLYLARRALLLQEIQYDKAMIDYIDTAAGFFSGGEWPQWMMKKQQHDHKTEI